MDTILTWYHALGLDIPSERIITSGHLLAPYFASRGLVGARCLVLGPEDSHRLVADAGGRILDPLAYPEIDAVVICDESGFPFLESVDAVLSCIIETVDSGRAIELILPNPDLVFPKGDGRFGVGIGSVAMILEAALTLRYPDRAMQFVRLGKPFRPLFEEAARRAGTRNLVMLGDQLATDILGASRFGIDSALVTTGLSRLDASTRLDEAVPTFLLPSLRPG